MTHSDTNISSSAVASFRENGFVHIPGIICQTEVQEFREASLRAAEKLRSMETTSIFDQFVNVWQQDATMKKLTLHAKMAAVAEQLAGVPLRLWHDQILIKQPHQSRSTEFHQDQPYWPHANSTHPISCWVALGDVPVESGCMTFIPGSHRRTDLPAQALNDATSLFRICPDLQWEPRVTVPLRAGDCTFHHGRCAHMATPNLTEDARVAHVVIYIDAGTTYTGRPHIVTDPLHLKEGEVLDHPLFPLAADLARSHEENS